MAPDRNDEVNQQTKGETMQTLVERYRDLPEAASVPDVVWDVQRLMERCAELNRELNSVQVELTDQTVKLMGVLRRDWSDEELRKAGLLT